VTRPRGGTAADDNPRLRRPPLDPFCARARSFMAPR